METKVDEIADHIYRLSTFVPDVGPTGFTCNQFLIDAEQPAIFHTGPRGMFPRLKAQGRPRSMSVGGTQEPRAGPADQWNSAQNIEPEPSKLQRTMRR